MITKAKLKELSAFRTAKVCDQEGLFVVEGPKMCEEALREGLPVRVVCATAEWLRGREVAAECHEVSQPELERLSGQKSPNQVWMLVERGFEPLCPVDDEGLVLALDRVQDPGNVGTIIRTADWFGIRRVVCSPGTASCFNPKVVQASMGGVFRTRVEYRDLPSFLEEAAAGGRRVYGALLDGEDVYRADLQPRKAVLAIGNESRGLSDEVRRWVDCKVLIPNIGGTCESLNAGVATAILCSEFMRR